MPLNGRLLVPAGQLKQPTPRPALHHPEDLGRRSAVVLAGVGATVTAEVAGLLPFSILRLETIAYVLSGLTALCFLAWAVLVSTGLIPKKNVFKQASTDVIPHPSARPGTRLIPKGAGAPPGRNRRPAV